MKIPLHKLIFNKEEIDNIIKSVESGKWVGDGEFSKKVLKRLKNILKSKYVYLTPSCSHSLEIACMLLLKRDDEVIMASFNFPSAANAVLRSGAKPVFAEIEEETLNIFPDDIESKITKKTKAIMVMHYGGISCDMNRIMNIAQKYNLFVIEDAAQCIGSYYNNRHLGTIGDVGCISFHQTKNISCGEGGLIIVKNKRLSKKVEVIREKGTDRMSFLRGEIDKYTWREVGSSYLLSDILASLLLAQVERMKYIIGKRKRIFDFYIKNLSLLERKGKLKLPKIPLYAKSNYHLFYILLPNKKIRDYCMKELNKNGIGATFHFLPLHSSPFAKKYLGYKGKDLPVTENLSQRLLRLPIFPNLKMSEALYIVENICKILR